MKRIISLSLPCFATDRWSRRAARRLGTGPSPAEAAPGTTPRATISEAQGRLTLAAVNPAAQAAGLVPGQGLADARALCPGLVVAQADPAGDAAALAALADWCGRYTPWTAPDFGAAAGTDGVWLDISGCAHLFGGEAALLADLRDRLAAAGLAARAAVADTPGAAWAAARFADPGITLIPPGGQRAALAGLPVAALRLMPATVAVLARLGLRRIGDLYGLPRAEVAARFGAGRLDEALEEQLQRRLDQALGLLDEPISRHNPRLGRPRPDWRARLPLTEPIGRAEDVAAGLGRLLGELCGRLEAAGHGARRLELALYRVDAKVRRLAVGASRPSRDPAHLQRLFADSLDGPETAGRGPEAGIELMILEATRTEPLAAVQLGGGGDDAPPAGDGTAALGALVDRLAARLGVANLFRLAPRESHLPERAVVAVPPLDPAAAGGGEQRWPAAGPRPLHLLPRPEPVEVATSPGGAPVSLCWRRARHALAAAEGPERIAPEWWRQAGTAPRDYYRVEDSCGRRFWLFRRGPDWFLHGLFA